MTTPTQPLSVQPVTSKEIQTDPITYIALGASDAVGVGTNQPGSQGYVPLIAARLPSGSHMINLGISGIHLHDALSRELPLAISTSPQLITIWLVANDFVTGVDYDHYMQDLDTLLQQLRAGTKARIVIGNLPDLSILPAFSNSSNDQKAEMYKEIVRWNKQIDVIAAHYQAIVVDLLNKNNQLTTHPEYISPDGFHPSPAGYVQLADFFWQAIIS